MHQNLYRVYCLLGIISASILFFEVLSTRVTKIVFSNDFSFIILALAFLGFGLGAIAAYFLRRVFIEKSLKTIVLLFALYAFSYVASVFILGYVPRQNLFFVSSLALYTIGGALTVFLFELFPARIHGLYAVTFVGSAFGALMSIGALQVVGIELSLKSGLVLVLLSVFLLAAYRTWKSLLAVTIGFGILSALFLATPIPIRCEYRVASIEDGKATHTIDNAYSHLEFYQVGAEAIAKDFARPSHKFLPLTAHTAVIDCIGETQLVLSSGRQDLGFIFEDIRSFPYLVRQFASVFVMGSGLGVDVERAVAASSSQVTAVEINPALISESIRLSPQYTPYGKEGVRVVISEGRKFLTQTNDLYDLLYISNSKRYGGQGLQPYALLENYLFTEEAFALYLDRLHEGGWLFSTDLTWFVHRYKDTLIRVLVERGEDPLQHLFLIRSGKYSALLYSKTVFSVSEKELFSDRAQEYGFSVIPIISDDVIGALDSRRSLVVTDDHPFFWNSFVSPFSEIELYPDALTRKNETFLSLQTLVFMLLIAGGVLLSALLSSLAIVPQAFRFIWFFMSIGMGFMLFEIALLQKFAPLFSSPVQAMVWLLGGLLIGAGLGSLFSTRVMFADGKKIRAISFIIFGLLLLGALGLSPLVSWLFLQADAVIVGVSSIVAVLPAIFLGTLFPLGVRYMNQESLVPWAFGINGLASVVGSIGATIIGLLFGFSSTFLCAAIMYLIATALFRVYR